VSEVQQLLRGVAPVDETLTTKKFNGLEGTLERWATATGEEPDGRGGDALRRYGHWFSTCY